MATWDGVTCSTIPLTELPDFGWDWGVVQSILGYGGSGFPFADITHAGWLPPSFFDLIEPGGGIGKGARDYPCYLGCVDFDVRANFYVKLGSSLHKYGDVIGDWSAYYDGGDTVPGDGDWHGVKLCVKAWKTKIYNAAPGDEVSVGSVDITVKPDV